MKKLLTTQQASDYLQALSFSLTRATMHTYRCIGKGPRYRKIGHLVRYTPEDLEDWILSRETVFETTDTIHNKCATGG